MMKTPCIIYLKGTCSSGKSTFIRKFISQYENVEVVDEDAIMHRSYVDAVAERFPAEFTTISSAIALENLYHALREKDVLFKKTASQAECAKAAAILAMIQEELDKPQNLAWKQEVSRGIDAEVLKNLSCARAK